MTTISEIEGRLNALAFSGRSYDGSTREEVKAAYTAAVADFEANAAVDIAYLAARVRELQAAINTAAAELADAAAEVADRYAGTEAEWLEIRVMIGDPVDKLVNVSQGTATTSEDGEQ